MASSPTTSLLRPRAVSFLRQPPKPKTTPPPPLRWNPLFVPNSALTRSLCLPIPVHAKFVRVRLHSSSVEAEKENQEVKRSPIGGGGGGGLLSWVLEALGAPKGPALAAVLLGLFLTVASPSAALSAASSPFPCHPSSSSHWSRSAFSPSSGHLSSTPTRLGADPDNSLLSVLMMMGSVTLLAGFLSGPIDEGNDPKLQVSMARSLPRALDWIGENTETSFLEGLSSVLTDYFIPQTYFRNRLVAPGLSHLKGGNSVFEWNNLISISRKLSFHGCCPDNKHRHLMKAVATSSPKCLVPNECDAKLLHGSELDAQVVQIQPSNDETPEIDDRERLRRTKISKANKGNVPWNKGKKHSPETLRRIRESTKLAMQDPKIKMKLANLGHAQSEETRIKIGAGVREGWRRRKEKMMGQEGCFFEWQNSIAESARKGCAGEDELHWDSYKTLDEQLKQQWLESIEMKKNKPKGSKRAPKSPEQRRKISEAISAKWAADEGYRARIRSGQANYYGTDIGAERRRRKPRGETPVRDTMKRKTIKSDSSSHEDRSIKKVVSKRRKNSNPLFKDPMASVKLEVIKKIRERRAAKEAKEVTERAKLLIAEAEKAAKALEMAALKSPLAQAALLETRKLIAEATQSIENIETGTLTTQDFRNTKSLDSGRPPNHFQGSSGVPSTEKFNERPVNGFHLFPSSRTNHKNKDFDKSSLQTAVNGWEPSTATQSTEKSVESSLPLHTNSVGNGSEKTCNQTSESDSRSVKHEDNSEEEDIRMSEVKNSVRSRTFSVKLNIKCEYKSEKKHIGISEVKNSVPFRTFSIKIKKKWVRGRLIEVEETEMSEEDSIQGNK